MISFPLCYSITCFIRIFSSGYAIPCTCFIRIQFSSGYAIPCTCFIRIDSYSMYLLYYDQFSSGYAIPCTGFIRIQFSSGYAMLFHVLALLGFSFQ